MRLDLTEEETDALTRLIRDKIGRDRFQFSARVQTLKGILASSTPAGRPTPLGETIGFCPSDPLN
jgi:hypothetical protein